MLVVPLSILGGVVAALRRDRIADRVITLTGLSLTAIPEFVSAIILILVFGLLFKVLPVNATAPAGSGFFTHVKYLLLPAMALTMVLFGYIARMARAGTIEALDADYTRTAFLKGLPHAHRDPPPRAAQLAAADDRGDRDADGLPDRRPRRDREGVQLQRHRPAHLHGGDEQGLHDAREQRARDRDRVPRRRC